MENRGSVSNHGRPMRATSIHDTQWSSVSSSYLSASWLKGKGLRNEMQIWSSDNHFEGRFHIQWVSASEALSVPTPSTSLLDICRRFCNSLANWVYSEKWKSISFALSQEYLFSYEGDGQRISPSFEQKMNTNKALNIWLGVAYTEQGMLQEGQFFPNNNLWERCVMSEIPANSTVS